MDKAGAIIIVVDDRDDQTLLKEVFLELEIPNEVIYFSDGKTALAHLKDTRLKPFLVLSDINLPELNGFALRDAIHRDDALRLKCTPFLFYTTVNDPNLVIKAYEKSIQGFFYKPFDFTELLTIIRYITEYWKHCLPPKIDPIRKVA